MSKRAGIFAAVIGLAAITQVAMPAGQLFVQFCRHDEAASPEDRGRRAQAMTLARAINTSQAEAVKRTGQYQNRAGLGALPAVPLGFELSLYADSNGYMFALKDSTDPCRFAVFSDTAGLLYEQSAIKAPIIAQ